MDIFHLFQSQNIIQSDDLFQKKILVAVSGGPDSIALLHLLYRLRYRNQWTIHVIHVDHHLREDSLKDALFVHQFAQEHGLFVHMRDCNVSRYATHCNKGLEESSRILRYQILSNLSHQLDIRFLFVGHHANDHAETILLHLIRGTGLEGLQGISSIRPLSHITNHTQDSIIQVVRPLLPFSKIEILQYLQEQKLKYRIDTSNQDIQLKRNWIRHQLISFIEKEQPQFIEKLFHLSEIVKSSQMIIHRNVEQMYQSVMQSSSQLKIKQFCHYSQPERWAFLHAHYSTFSYVQIKHIERMLCKSRLSIVGFKQSYSYHELMQQL